MRLPNAPAVRAAHRMVARADRTLPRTPQHGVLIR